MIEHAISSAYDSSDEEFDLEEEEEVVMILAIHVNKKPKSICASHFSSSPKSQSGSTQRSVQDAVYGPTVPRSLPPCRNGGTPANVVVEESLRVWAFSHWRGSTELARGFLRAGFHHLPAGSPPMFNLVERRPHANAPPVGLVVHFTNRFDAYHLLGKVYWCGCEFIAFTTYNIFTDFESIFPLATSMHSLPYYLGDNGLEEEEY
ncbi:Auxin-induced protein 5NG4 [Hordeum vulgare]|nr:Auxin-induced protein 5NG4 [Hordeum vulgare]